MLVLWLALAVVGRDYPQSTTPEAWLRIAEMSALAILGLLASLKKWPLLMLVVFLASFIPVGLYLLGVPSVFRLIGVTDLLYLVAAFWLLADWLRSFPENGWVGNLRNWVWISSSVFALLAGLLRISLFPAPEWNTPIIFYHDHGLWRLRLGLVAALLAQPGDFAAARAFRRDGRRRPHPAADVAALCALPRRYNPPAAGSPGLVPSLCLHDAGAR
jgi:hypothetical protein